MSIEGLGPVVPQMPAQPAERAAAPPQPETASGAAQSPSVTPPEGVDADLWALLTPDEQAFFAEQRVLGPLTYGPQSDATTTTPPRGQRIDVRA